MTPPRGLVSSSAMAAAVAILTDLRHSIRVLNTAPCQQIPVTTGVSDFSSFCYVRVVCLSFLACCVRIFMCCTLVKVFYFVLYMLFSYVIHM